MCHLIKFSTTRRLLESIIDREVSIYTTAHRVMLLSKKYCKTHQIFKEEFKKYKLIDKTYCLINTLFTNVKTILFWLIFLFRFKPTFACF